MEKRKYRSLVRLNRKISWILLLVAIATIFSGYALSHNVFNRYLLSPVHIWLEISFTGLLVLHILLTLFLKQVLRIDLTYLV